MTRRIAIVDPGSFVLPYDFHLVKALAATGSEVDFYGSTTRYNGEFLEAMGALPKVCVKARGISSTVASRLGSAFAYVLQLIDLLMNASRYDTINLQFIGAWPIEWPVFWWLRRKFVYTVHNAVPHGFTGERHAPTQRLAQLARALVFISEATHDDFIRRYGDVFEAKSTVVPHGVSPVAPQVGVTRYDDAPAPKSLVFWGTVKPYKGVELFKDLATSNSVTQRGLSLAIHGAWDQELMGLRDELRQAGVYIDDSYLSQPQLLDLLSQDAVFLLPYQRASQSGALYSLLNHGRLFICADTGDLGAFMRQHGLEGLLMKDRSVESVIACLDHLAAHESEVRQAFQKAQDSLRWERLVAAFPHVAR